MSALCLLRILLLSQALMCAGCCAQFVDRTKHQLVLGVDQNPWAELNSSRCSVLSQDPSATLKIHWCLSLSHDS